MLILTDIDILRKHILEQRRLNPRNRGGRGWQSKLYTDQPFPWFDATYKAVEAQEGKVDSWWFNVNTPGEHTGWHSHSCWDKVGVLYVSVPGGDIEFKDSAAYWRETPQSGNLLVFPGNLIHRVTSNSSKDVRISIAFNFKNGK